MIPTRKIVLYGLICASLLFLLEWIFDVTINTRILHIAVFMVWVWIFCIKEKMMQRKQDLLQNYDAKIGKYRETTRVSNPKKPINEKYSFDFSNEEKLIALIQSHIQSEVIKIKKWYLNIAKSIQSKIWKEHGTSVLDKIPNEIGVNSLITMCKIISNSRPFISGAYMVEYEELITYTKAFIERYLRFIQDDKNGLNIFDRRFHLALDAVITDDQALHLSMEAVMEEADNYHNLCGSKEPRIHAVFAFTNVYFDISNLRDPLAAFLSNYGRFSDGFFNNCTDDRVYLTIQLIPHMIGTYYGKKGHKIESEMVTSMIRDGSEMDFISNIDTLNGIHRELLIMRKVMMLYTPQYVAIVDGAIDQLVQLKADYLPTLRSETSSKMPPKQPLVYFKCSDEEKEEEEV